jgi:hypothetical protein
MVRVIYLHKPKPFRQIYKELRLLGLWCFPINSQKKPMVEHWTPYRDQRPSKETALNWFREFPDAGDAGGGLPTGPGTGVFVVDADSAAAITGLERKGMPDTWSVCTRKGRHWYFLWPDFIIQNSASKVAPGLDVRGRGGFVAVPGSPGSIGFAYHWAPHCSPSDVSLASAPQWLLDVLRPKLQPVCAPVSPKPFSGSITAYARAALKQELERMCTARDGCRNDTACRVAFKLGQLVAGGELPEAQVREALYTVADGWLDAAKTRDTIDRQMQAGASSPRCRPIAEAQSV